MECSTDICRICIQRCNSENVEEIDLNKFQELVQKSVLPNWDVQLFKEHVICMTCIDSFRTINVLSYGLWRSNALLSRLERKTSKDKQINLKELPRFKQYQDPFFVCRLCLLPTTHVAVYLEDNPSNIIPMEFITSMLMINHLKMDRLERTENPILCFICWQRVQVSFAFRKHLNSAMDKIEHYQTLLGRLSINREDLQDILHMWDNLGTTESGTTRLQLKHPIEKVRKPRRPQNMPELFPAILDDHCYSKKIDSYCLTSTSSDSDESASEMPILQPSIIQVTNEKKLNVSDRVLRNRDTLLCSKVTPTIPSKKISRKKKRTKRLKTGYKGGCKFANSNRKKDDHYNFRSTNQSSFKEESMNSYQDLLVIQKEKVLKTKPLKKQKYVEPPTIPSPKRKGPSPVNIIVPTRTESVDHLGTEQYTFEIRNFDNEIQGERSEIQSQDAQIKREVLSDDDDLFIENSANVLSDHVNTDEEEQCPALESFIKTEPADIIDIDENNKDEPPDLDLQGPCVYNPSFTISNTFSIADNRPVITVDEKRDLINSVIETPSTSNVRRNSVPVPQVNAEDELPVLYRFNEVEKSVEENPGNMLPVNLTQSNASSESKKTIELKDVFIRLTKCDLNLVSKFEPKITNNKSTSNRKSVKSGEKLCPDLRQDNKEKLKVPNRKPHSPKKSNRLRQKNVKNKESLVPPSVKQSLIPAPLNNLVPPEKFKDEMEYLIKSNMQDNCIIDKSNPNESSAILKPSTSGEIKNAPISKEFGYNTTLGERCDEIDKMCISSEKKIKCKLCGFLTDTAQRAKIHHVSHWFDSRKYHCIKCPYKTNTKHQYVIHWLNGHSGKVQFRDKSGPLEKNLCCGLCSSPGAEHRCHKCNHYFHSACLLTDQTKHLYKCDHFDIMTRLIITSKGLVECQPKTHPDKQAVCCHICGSKTSSWVHCQRCLKHYHFKCFTIGRFSKEKKCTHPFLIT